MQMTAPRVHVGFNPNGTRGFTISPSRSKTHPNLPKGKEQVTQNINISPHLASPVGEGQVTLDYLITSGLP